MLKDHLQEVEEKICAACERAGRKREDVTLIAVSKTKPVETLKEAYDLGIRVFGENKVQELTEKYEVLPKDIRWHMIGHLQTNKVKYIADKVELIHSVDSLKLAETIEKEALASSVPIIRREMQSFLKVLLLLQKPMRILEVGTAVGFSALLMSEYAPAECRITTIENYEKRIPIARENFRRAGREQQITLIEGDAAEVLKDLDGTYDFIFMDAAKGQYIHYLPDVLRLLADGGCLVSDNVMQDGDVIESRFAVERRNRTIHARMREYLYELKHREELTTSILPLGDGAAVSVKRGAGG